MSIRYSLSEIAAAHGVKLHTLQIRRISLGLGVQDAEWRRTWRLTEAEVAQILNPPALGHPTVRPGPARHRKRILLEFPPDVLVRVEQAYRAAGCSRNAFLIEACRLHAERFA